MASALVLAAASLAGVPRPALAGAIPVSIASVHGAFYSNPNNSGQLDVSNLVTPVFTQDFPVLDFNPPASAQVRCSNNTGIGENTRPFTDVVPDPDGTCSTVVAQGGGQQAGVGNLFTFQGIFTANLNVAAQGQVTFNFYSDDGWMLGAGKRQGGTEQPSYISGSMVNPLSATPGQKLPVVGSYNVPSAPAQNQVTVNFPSAGTYPLELDYTECCGGQLALVLGTTFGNPIPPAATCSNTVIGTPPPTGGTPAVIVRAIEVNQVVQDWCNSVPVIAGKSTLVRVHLQNTTTTAQSVTVYLNGTLNGVSLGQLQPVNPGNLAAGPITVAASQDAETVRSGILSTANFLLPTSWESGTVVLTAVPAPGQQFGCADRTSVPSACTARVTFQASPVFHLTLVQGAYPDPNGSAACFRADTGVMNEEVARLYEVLPLAPGQIDLSITVPLGGNQCLGPSSDYNPVQGCQAGMACQIWGGPLSWQQDAFNGPGLNLAQAAFQAAGQPHNRYFVTILPASYGAWFGTSGQSSNAPSANTVWFVGHAPPFVDPWFASRYEIAHELMHAMQIKHPGPWIGDSDDSHSVSQGLCGESDYDSTPRPSVAVSSHANYSFNPGIEGRYQSAQWSTFGTYPQGRAYSLGSMTAATTRKCGA
jgi:hypothetical protein